MTWIQTFTGRSFPLLDPDAGDISLTDISYALAELPRFTGHALVSGYSVAQHSIYVARRVMELLERGEAADAAEQFSFPWVGDHVAFAGLVGLLHDAHEAYIGDVSWPMKQALRELGGEVLGQLEAPINRELATWAFGASRGDLFRHNLVKRADLELLATERRDLMSASHVEWGQLPEPLEGRIREGWPRDDVAHRFRELFHELRERAGLDCEQPGAVYDLSPVMVCPRCKATMADYDGVGVLHHAACGEDA